MGYPKSPSLDVTGSGELQIFDFKDTTTSITSVLGVFGLVVAPTKNRRYGVMSTSDW